MNLKYVFTCILCSLFLNVVRGQEVFTLYFDTDSDAIAEKDKNEFRAFLQQKELENILEIRSFCDHRASVAYNKVLGNKRLMAVQELIKTFDLPLRGTPQRVNFGKEFNQHPNLSLNRKVEVVVIFKPVMPLPIAMVEESVEAVQIEPIKQTLRDFFETAQKGDIFVAEDIRFEFNSTVLAASSKDALEDLLFGLELFPNISIEIGGHICCNPDKKDLKLSLQRAKTIADFLVRNGVSSSRLLFVGYGSNFPIFPIPEKSEIQKARNRRIEIKVL
jgi:outer membrane protein OmpA-like peptidoglycan-associated protein